MLSINSSSLQGLLINQYYHFNFLNFLKHFLDWADFADSNQGNTLEWLDLAIDRNDLKQPSRFADAFSFSIDTLEYPLWTCISLLLCEDTTANGLCLSEHSLWWPLMPPQHVPNSQNTTNPSFWVYHHLHDWLITHMHWLKPFPSSFSSCGFLTTLFLFPHLYIKP